MTWTTPTNVSSGEADSGKFNTETVANLLHLYQTMPHAKTATVTAAAGTTSSTSYVDVPTAVSISNFVKAHADTVLRVEVTGHMWLDDALVNAQVAVNIGGTVTELDSVSTLSASGAHGVAGSRLITGIGAGNIATIKLQWKVSAGTVVATMVGRWTLTVTEVLP